MVNVIVYIRVFKTVDQDKIPLQKFSSNKYRGFNYQCVSATGKSVRVHCYICTL